MKDLITKLEAAETGSRNLDAGIAVCVNWEERGVPIREFLQKHPDASVFHWGFPRYTTSIDAALTLVPEGWGIASIWEAAKPKDRPWWGVHLRRDEPYKMMKTMDASTPALALCIAAIKARDAS